jgi:Sec-independent protein translocase protein TatA
MEILGIGPLEFLFILIIALVVIGPRDLGKYARSVGRSLNRLFRSDTWRMLTETSRNLRSLPNRLAREAALEELDEAQHTIGQIKSEINEDIRSVDEGLKAWTKPDHHHDPPEDTEPTASDPPPPGSNS